MPEAEPRYVWGFIGPTGGGGDGGRERPQRLLPADVKEVTVGLGIEDYTVKGVEDAIGRYGECVDSLIRQKAQRVVLGGVPICSQLGRSRLLKLSEEAQKRTGVLVDSTNEAIIAAFGRLGVKRVAIASRWAGQLNRAMTDYLAEAGITTVAITSEGQWARDGAAMSLERGMVLAVQLARQAMRETKTADALLLPGGAWPSLGAVPILEEEFDIPVVTNDTARSWRIIADGFAPAIEGWGRLLANPGR